MTSGCVTEKSTCSCSWQNKSTYQIWSKSDEKCKRYRGRKPNKWAKLEVNWRACAFTTSGFIGHRTWFTFQIWGRSDKNGRYCGQTDTHADRQTDIHSSDFISTGVMHCIGQTIILLNYSYIQVRLTLNRDIVFTFSIASVPRKRQ